MSKVIISGLFVFLSTCFMGCLPKNPCTDVIQLPPPFLNLLVVSPDGKSKFSYSGDTNYYNPDSLVLYVGSVIKDNRIKFTGPFAAANDSLIKTDKWILMSYLNPRSNYLFVKYNKDKIDTLFIRYAVDVKNCSGSVYSNFTLTEVDLVDTVKIEPVNNIYKIIHN